MVALRAHTDARNVDVGVRSRRMLQRGDIEGGTEGVDETAERGPSEITIANLARLLGADGMRDSCWTLNSSGQSEGGQSGGSCTEGGLSVIGTGRLTA